MGITRRQTTITVITLVITFAVSIPAAFVILPIVYRHHQLARLASADAAQRRLALSYIQRHVADHPEIVPSIVPVLGNLDNKPFLQTVAILEASGHWQPPTIPADLYLRYVGLLADDPSEDSRSLATRKLAGAFPDISLEQARPMLSILLRDPSPQVRYNALIAAGQFNGKDTSESLADLILPAARDSESVIAYHACMMLTILDGELEPVKPDSLVSLPPAVQSARVYAATRSVDADRLQETARTIVDDSRISLPARAMALAALRYHPMGDDDLRTEYLGLSIDDITADNQLLVWRSIMFMPESSIDRYRPLLTRLATADASRPLLAPLVHAATSRLAIAFVSPTDSTRLKELAALEGAPPASMDITIAAQSPDMLRLAALRAMKHPTVEAMLPLFDSPHVTIHNQAALIAATRLSPDQQAEIIARLLLNYSETARQSASMIYGLAPQQTLDKHIDLQLLLQNKIDDEDQWHVKRTLELGPWMRQQKPYPPQYTVDLLARPDIPATTALLALFARQPRAALDYLLSPTDALRLIQISNEESVEVLELLVKHRWIYILEHYLPQDAPKISPWADGDLQQFQFDLLRDWYLLNRYRFADTDS